MLQRLITLTVWILVGWTATSLLLRLLPSAPQAPDSAQALAPEPAPPADWTRLLGAAPEQAPTQAEAPPPPESSRFQLLGVVAAREPGQQGRQGVALLSIDGAPGKSFRVGQGVDGDLRLLAVEPRAVSLGRQGAPAFQLQLPPPPAPAVGVLPPAAPPGGAHSVPTAAAPSMPTPPPTLPALPVRSTPPTSGGEQPALYPGAPGPTTAIGSGGVVPPTTSEDTGPHRRRSLESR